MRSKYEIKAQKELEKEGYRVDNKAGVSKWTKNVDYFNLFDLLAVKKGAKLRFVSIKGKMGVPSAHLQEISEFWLPDDCVKEIWSVSLSKKKFWVKKIINS